MVQLVSNRTKIGEGRPNNGDDGIDAVPDAQPADDPGQRIDENGGTPRRPLGRCGLLTQIFQSKWPFAASNR